MTVRRVVIPAECRSLAQVYDVLARHLGLPPGFGRNLDALWDSLTRDIDGPFTIVVEDAAALERALGDKGPALLGLLRDLRRHRKDATVTIRRKKPHGR